ncbi:hypothetical protein DMC63_40140 [Streptomyces sp. WAC 05977]|nr:hypothetical protein DMC63_40140 [Streptomyces sp. WAC 05977]
MVRLSTRDRVVKTKVACCESHFRNLQRCESGFRNTSAGVDRDVRPGDVRRGSRKPLSRRLMSRKWLSRRGHEAGPAEATAVLSSMERRTQ